MSINRIQTILQMELLSQEENKTNISHEDNSRRMTPVQVHQVVRVVRHQPDRSPHPPADQAGDDCQFKERGRAGSIPCTQPVEVLFLTTLYILRFCEIQNNLSKCPYSIYSFTPTWMLISKCLRMV